MTTGVLFDLDGTLVDTVYLHVTTWWQALRQHGHDVEMARIHRSIGMGSDRILEHLLGEEPDDADAITEAHSTLYAVYWDRLRLTPGAQEVLRAVKDHGMRVVLASSAGAPELKALLKTLNADDVIDVATGSADAEKSKPAPDIVQVALKRAKLDPAESIFVGDAVWDVHAAGAVDLPCVGLTCGGVSEAELLDAGAAAVFENPAALLDSGYLWKN